MDHGTHSVEPLREYTWLRDAAIRLDVSEQHLRQLILEGQFKSARVVGKFSRMFLLDPKEVTSWAADPSRLPNAVPFPRRSNRTLTKHAAPSMLSETFPPVKRWDITVDRLGDYFVVDDAAVTPQPPNTDGRHGFPTEILSICADLICPGGPLDDVIPNGNWPASYVESHPSCIIVGGPRGRAAFRPSVATSTPAEESGQALDYQLFGAGRLPVSLIVVTEPVSWAKGSVPWKVRGVYVREGNAAVWVHPDWDMPWQGDAEHDAMWTYFAGRILDGSFGNGQAYELWGAEVPDVPAVAPLVAAYAREIHVDGVFGKEKRIYIRPMELVPKNLKVSVVPASDPWMTADPIKVTDPPEGDSEDDRP